MHRRIAAQFIALVEAAGRSAVATTMCVTAIHRLSIEQQSVIGEMTS
jgi:hypothetical protein